MTNNDTFAKRLIQRRAEQGYSQEELSKISGIAAAQISRYEAGRNKPRANIIAKLAEALDISFEWLAYGDISNNKSDINKNEFKFYVNLPKEQYDLIVKNAMNHDMDTVMYIQKVIIPQYLSNKGFFEEASKFAKNNIIDAKLIKKLSEEVQTQAKVMKKKSIKS
jgi:transcriptional regulator with XRE-family HTH domain